MIVGPLMPPADPQGFVRIHERQNVITGEWIRLSPPAEIHKEDLDWLQRLWEDGDRLALEIWRGGTR